MFTFVPEQQTMEQEATPPLHDSIQAQINYLDGVVASSTTFNSTVTTTNTVNPPYTYFNVPVDHQPGDIINIQHPGYEPLLRPRRNILPTFEEVGDWPDREETFLGYVERTSIGFIRGKDKVAPKEFSPLDLITLTK